ncbi:MAG: cation transporter [Candidatus Methanoperedenaceae archaeon]|nr:cation transporter [Candidatus Methanoperedenaceae archaeon]MDW7727904.1 cation transporter [Candidatus Methanoperedens sp.]
MTQKLHKKALVLSYITVAYNIIEGIVSIIAGSIAGSAALVGFGLDSFVESLSGSIMIWRFRQHSKISREEEERLEKKAVKLVAYTFFILAAYVFYESATKLFNSEIPQPSIIGIIIAVISIIAMPVLFFMKYRTGRSLNSKSLVADSKQTLACLFLSVALLFGLSLNYLYGFWQADPVVGLLISGYLVKEGYSTIREEELCSC